MANRIVPALPSAFVYLTGASVLERLACKDQYSGHVYAKIGDQIIFARSLRYDNIFGPGGEIEANETLLEGIARELNEEVPTIAQALLDQLLGGSAVGMWRQTSRGFHNTFLVEVDLDLDLANKQHLELIKSETRPDHLEADGGLVGVPLAQLQGDQGDQGLKIRPVILPVVAELKHLCALAQLDKELKSKFAVTQSFYHQFGICGIQDGRACTLTCLSCGCEKIDSIDFCKYGLAFGKDLFFCSDCALKYNRSMLDLRDHEPIRTLASRFLRQYSKMLENR